MQLKVSPCYYHLYFTAEDDHYENVAQGEIYFWIVVITGEKYQYIVFVSVRHFF